MQCHTDPTDDTQGDPVEFRHLGSSGLKVSAVSYGNWVTPAQVRDEQATACVRAALDAGITTFDTADTYGNGHAEEILGAALAGERRASVEILTKVFGATGPGGPNDSGLSRKHILESITASLTRLQTDYVDLYQAHRYDFATPLEETMEAFADVVRAGKALYIGVSEWTPDQLRAGHALARELKIPFIANQSKYNALYRVIEPDVVPTCRELGIGQICFSPIEQGILTGKYRPGQPAPAGSRATDTDGGAPFITGLLTDDLLTRVGNLAPLAVAEGLSMAQLAVAWVLANDNVASAITGGSRPEQVTDNAGVAGKTLSPSTLAAIDEALGDRVERDGSLVGSMSPTQRPT
jgi:aryl-alcohol dehydrogenase-like predicted oxidoreductase